MRLRAAAVASSLILALTLLPLQPGVHAARPSRTQAVMPVPFATATPLPGPTATPTPIPVSVGPTFTVYGPGGGEAALLDLIARARARILVDAFDLNDSAIYDALVAARRRGVDVRVMLDHIGLNAAATLAALQRAGIRTHEATWPGGVSHLDAVVVDAGAAAILTTPLRADEIGSSGHGYTVIDRDRRDVLQVASIFYDDWLQRPITLFNDHLVVLPDELDTLTSLIDHTRLRLELYTSNLSDSSVLDGLAAARRRGVVVSVLAKGGDAKGLQSRSLTSGDRIHIRDEGQGTVLIADRRVLFLGSMDLTTTALTNNRELGIVLPVQSVALSAYSGFFRPEFLRGRVLAPPAPASTKNKNAVKIGPLSVKPPVVPPRVRIGGEEVIVISATHGATVQVTVTYPPGSKLKDKSTSGQGAVDKHGTFVYRWLVPPQIKPGPATVRIVVRLNKYKVTYNPYTVTVTR